MSCARRARPSKAASSIARAELAERDGGGEHAHDQLGLAGAGATARHPGLALPFRAAGSPMRTLIRHKSRAPTGRARAKNRPEKPTGLRQTVAAPLNTLRLSPSAAPLMPSSIGAPPAWKQSRGEWGSRRRTG
eukprot:9503051-Pyramimonas_sp.AAC.1